MVVPENPPLDPGVIRGVIILPGNGGGGGVRAWACWAATTSGLSLGFRVEVPFRTSHMAHLKASGLFLNVQTLQSQVSSSCPPPLAELRFLLFRIK